MGYNIDRGFSAVVNYREVVMYNKVMLHPHLLFLATVFFGRGKLVVWGLSCVEDAFSISRREAIRESYCYR